VKAVQWAASGKRLEKDLAPKTEAAK